MRASESSERTESERTEQEQTSAVLEALVSPTWGSVETVGSDIGGQRYELSEAFARDRRNLSWKADHVMSTSGPIDFIGAIAELERTPADR